MVLWFRPMSGKGAWDGEGPGGGGYGGAAVKSEKKILCVLGRSHSCALNYHKYFVSLED